ncbi:rho GTPase-activating protein 5 [Selaginella moellendorffii]|nr:rho GTPase-activating protein 5 [Selaginella moellendorffii]XP_024537009.1 rho GTPase-activating protein 5 [Selaginella moellendorffii]XP_024537010.1 rho GTPase-activating protein 5 [Selaginella moellendorffii]XP_024537011.1 rho GTPase-activating protein 5 [Selaginella moellendorffii]XP_024537012.1 rho GTPase-activating protein 5 [Selaginella moellendorffii]|eukprot:XP_002976304.2 rho GTPase-activating protein 5 [Selaginella moellendorffii]
MHSDRRPTKKNSNARLVLVAQGNRQNLKKEQADEESKGEKATNLSLPMTMADLLTHRHFSPDILESDAYSISGLSPPLFVSDHNTTDSEEGSRSDSGVVSSSPVNLPATHTTARAATDGMHLSLEFEDLVIRREKMRLRGEQLAGGEGEEEANREELSMLALVLDTLRRSLLTCKASEEEVASMDIGWPTNVRHVTHVTFDRFNGFLGLPVEFEIEIPRRVPSASASVFGVSPESMQCSYDSKGNSVPTILLLMQERLYSQGGLKAEGIFRINAENSHEEIVREQLNRGIVPHDIDLHCLAGLIKAWFRELPKGVLDTLTPEQVMQCHNEEQCVELVKLLPPTQAALLDWALNLMADVAQEEASNKMNSRNIAMVFAPNMTQMADPLTALMHAVQVMNILKTLIVRTLRDRQEAVLDPGPAPSLPSNKDEDDDQQHCGSGLIDKATSAEEEYDDYRQHQQQQQEQEELDQNHRHHHLHNHHQQQQQVMMLHAKQKKIRSAAPRLLNRIDKQSERAEAW